MKAFIQALQSHAPHPSPYARPLRICVRGQHDFGFVWMLGGVNVPGTLETIEEVERLMREKPGPGKVSA